ncbi:alpha/beta hydrolase [Pseudoduganella sp. UC29_71]|uniref:alpha/beta hydrolase n=1 Tax=Pseudoduganella sp. UC29_71 TaxID=3350174 RepID=UPI00366B6743
MPIRAKLYLLLGAGAAGLLLLAGAGEALSRPATHAIGPAPAELHARDVVLPLAAPGSGEGAGGAGVQHVAGWFIAGAPGAGAVLLLHGVRGDRSAMLARARFLRRAGYAVLLLDLPSHGASSGERITFGWREAAGVAAAMAFLRRELPGEKIGVIGVSLGAAALMFSGERPDAAVLESMYPTITEAVSDRLRARLGPLGGAAAPLLLWQLPIRLGLSPAQLAPIDRIAAFKAPLLIASGSEDLHTTAAETRRIYAAAPEPKQLWMVPGAAHVDLHGYGTAEYERIVLAILARHLRGASPAPAGAAGT